LLCQKCDICTKARTRTNEGRTVDLVFAGRVTIVSQTNSRNKEYQIFAIVANILHPLQPIYETSKETRDSFSFAVLNGQCGLYVFIISRLIVLPRRNLHLLVRRPNYYATPWPANCEIPLLRFNFVFNLVA
jgi:hypothetical protein